MGKRGGLAALGVACLIACSTCWGCTASSSTATCYPPLPKASPQLVVVGQPVTVTGDAFTCGTRYPRGKTYGVTFGHSGSEKPLGSMTVPVNRDGSFVVQVAFPASTPLGMAWISIAGSPYDRPCNDTDSCVSFDATVTVVPG